MSDVYTLSFTHANAIAQKAIAILERYGAEASVAVVSQFGLRVMVFLKMDQARDFTADVALNKARQSASTGKRTRGFVEQIMSEGTRPELFGLTDSTLIPWPGGVPIYDTAGRLLGGLGVSNLKGDEDEEIAIEAVQRVGFLSERPQ